MNDDTPDTNESSEESRTGLSAYVRPSHAQAALEDMDEVEENLGDDEALQFALAVPKEDIPTLREELEGIVANAK